MLLPCYHQWDSSFHWDRHYLNLVENPAFIRVRDTEVGRLPGCRSRAMFPPDLVTLAKGIGFGYPVAVLAGRPALLIELAQAVADGFSSTFGDSQVALAATAMTLEVLAHDDMLAQVRRLADVMKDALGAVVANAVMGEIRQPGLLCGIEFVTCTDDREPAPELAARALSRAAALGVRVIPGGHIIRLVPPFVIDEAVLCDPIGRLGRTISEACR